MRIIILELYCTELKSIRTLYTKILHTHTPPHKHTTKTIITPNKIQEDVKIICQIKPTEHKLIRELNIIKNKMQQKGDLN